MTSTPNKSNPTTDSSRTLILMDDPRDSNIRWLFLFFACMLTLGTYYGHDSISIFQIQFEKTLGISTTAFNSLSTAFYLPCTFMPILGGILAEKLGIRPILVFFSICVCIGELTLALGVYNQSFSTMLAGRAIHGFGHDAMLALNKAIVAKWFYKKDLALAIGLTVAVSRFGSSLSSKFGTMIYNSNNNLTYPFIFALLIGIFSCLCCISQTLIDGYADRKIADNRKGAILKSEFKLSDLKNLKLVAIYLIITYFLVSPPIFCYSNNNAAVLSTRFGFDMESAGDFNLMFFVTATVLTPLIGFLSDKYGGKVNILIFSGALQLFAHAFIILIPDSKDINYFLIIPNLSIGISLACFASAFWPSLTVVTSDSMRGTVFGITYSGMNIILASLMIVVGEIKDSTIETSGGYFWTQVLLGAICALGLATSYLVKKEDLITGMRLHRSAQNDSERLLPKNGNLNLELSNA